MEKMENLYSIDKAEQEAELVTKRLDKMYPNQDGKFTNEQYESMNEQMSAEQVELIKKLSEIGVPLYLIGGYASDLLLLEKDGVFEGEFAHPHTDIDMLVDAENKDVLAQELLDLGFKTKERTEEGSDKPNKIYISRTDSIQGDFGILETETETGKKFFNVSIKGRGFRLYIDDDLQNGPEVKLGDTLVKIVSPRALIQSLLFYTQLGISELREKDKVRAEMLCQKFFPGETLDSDMFKLKMEEISTQ